LDGECVKIVGKCNGFKNCKDGSDEGDVCKTTTPTTTTSSTEVVATTTTAAVALVDDSCHTAVQGELCHYKVEWAEHHGIHEHPEWYKGLTAWSSFEDFQKELWRGRYGNCSRPCEATSTTTKATTVTKTTTTLATTTTEETTSTFTETTTTTGVPSINATLACSTEDLVYMPMDKRWGMSIEDNVSACQARCARTDGCAHFTYYKPLRNCHMQDSDAKPVKHNLLFTAGPPVCSSPIHEMNFRRKFLSRPGRSIVEQHFPLVSPALTCVVAAITGTALTMLALHRLGRGRRQALAACTAPGGTQSYASLLRPSSACAPASAGAIEEAS
jgi:hypothetical protein